MRIADSHNLLMCVKAYLMKICEVVQRFSSTSSHSQQINFFSASHVLSHHCSQARASKVRRVARKLCIRVMISSHLLTQGNRPAMQKIFSSGDCDRRLTDPPILANACKTAGSSWELRIVFFFFFEYLQRIKRFD